MSKRVLWISIFALTAAGSALGLAGEFNPDLSARAEAEFQRLSSTLQKLQMSDGQWQGAIEADPTADLMPLLLSGRLGLAHPGLQEESLARIFDRQDTATGLWPEYPGGPASADVTGMIALSLESVGLVAATDPRLARAQAWIDSKGGAEKSLQTLNKMISAFAGDVPINSVPILSPKFLAFPEISPLNILNVGFGRTGLVPWIVWAYYHQLNAVRKTPGKPIDPERLKSAGAAFAHPTEGPIDPTGVFKTLFEPGMSFSINGMMDLVQETLPVSDEFWAQEGMGWILAHQQPDGTWAGALQITYFSIFALHEAQLAGLGDYSQQIQKAWEGLMGWRTKIPEGSVIQQSTEGPVMDTARILTAASLAPQSLAGMSSDSRKKALNWLVSSQILSDGDWKYLAPNLSPGGWAFEYWNSPYPDCDDTGMVLEALVHSGQGSDPSVGLAINRGTTWLLGLQNSDGGFPAWDKGTSPVFEWMVTHPSLLHAPDVGDVSQSDITSRVLRGLTVIRDSSVALSKKKQVLKAIQKACGFIESKKASIPGESLPVWEGEWMVDYLYGTAESTGALLLSGCWDAGKDAPYAQWLVSKQNADGGWGESPESYTQGRFVQASSTLTQTEFVLESLITFEQARAGQPGLASVRPAIDRGIQWLLDRVQGQDYPWESEFTGVYVRGVWYGRYVILPHYEAIRALGMYSNLGSGKVEDAGSPAVAASSQP